MISIPSSDKANEFNTHIHVNEHHRSDPAARWGTGGKKHEIYVAAFGGHLFYDLFLQGWRGAWPSRPPPPDPLLTKFYFKML